MRRSWMILRSFSRYTKAVDIWKRLPVGSKPRNSRMCVPSTLETVTTTSPSITRSSTKIVISRNASNICLMAFSASRPVCTPALGLSITDASV